MLRQILSSFEHKEGAAEGGVQDQTESDNSRVVRPHVRHLSELIRQTLLVFKLIIALFFLFTIIVYFFHLLFGDDHAKRDHLLSVATQLASAVALQHGTPENKTKEG